MATHSSIIAWRIPWPDEPTRLQSMGLQRVGHNWATNTHTNPFSFPGSASGKESACQCRRCKRHRFNPWIGMIPWSRKWQPASVKFYGQRSWLVTVHGAAELDKTEWLSTHKLIHSPPFLFCYNDQAKLHHLLLGWLQWFPKWSWHFYSDLLTVHSPSSSHSILWKLNQVTTCSCSKSSSGFPLRRTSET